MKLLTLTSLLALAILSFAAPTPDNTTADTQSRTSEDAGPDRRGVAFNDHKFPHLFNGTNNKISWMYNWASDLCGFADQATGFGVEYVPMLHSNKNHEVSQWADNVRRCANFGDGKGGMHIVAMNEPDMCIPGAGGSCMSMEAVLGTWYQHIEPLRKYGDRIKLGSPAVTNQGGDLGLNFLRNFISKCIGCKIDFINIHWYDGSHKIQYFKNHIQEAIRVGKGRPVWITEFGLTSGSDEDKRGFLREALPWLDSQKDVHRYAYHMAAAGILVNNDGTGLSNLGNVYTYT